MLSGFMLYYVGSQYGWIDAPSAGNIPANNDTYLGVVWLNSTDKVATGHVDLVDKDGKSIPSYYNNDQSASPGNGKIVGFGPFRLPGPGSYPFTATLRFL